MQSSIKKSGRFQGGMPYNALYEPVNKSANDSVWFDGMSHTGTFSVESRYLFSQVLVDQKKNYWFSEKKDKKKEKTNIYIFNERGLFLKNVVVIGNPNLYEFGESVFAACEGSDGKSRIYEYCTESYRLTQQWTLDGFLWDIEKVNGRLYVSSYLAGEDEAVLYNIQGQQTEKLKLGTQFFPTELLGWGTSLYISAFPVLDSDKKKIIELNENQEIVNEVTLNVPPYRFYLHEPELVIHGVELLTGKEEKLVYYNINTGEQKEYSIPQAFTVKESNNQLYLFNPKTQSVVKWHHNERKMTYTNQVPYHDIQKDIDFQSYNQ